MPKLKNFGMEKPLVTFRKNNAFTFGASMKARKWAEADCCGNWKMFWTPDPSVDKATGNKIGHWTMQFDEETDAILFQYAILAGPLSHEYFEQLREFYRE